MTDAGGGTAFVLGEQQYVEDPESKRVRLLDELNSLTALHVENCLPYRRILQAAFGGRTRFDSLGELPALPARLFKELELVSVPRDQVAKVLTSSGTSGQLPSRILLDKATASAQARTLVSIVRAFIGSKRLPMMIIDHPAVLKDRSAFSARGAGILGFSQFGSDHTYALRDGTLAPDWNVVEAFLSRHHGDRVLLFGFTFIIWQHFLRAAQSSGRSLDFGDSILIHGGGWKKLNQQLSNQDFKSALHETLGIRSIYNYYGMVEQTGSIYMECEAGHFHAADCCEILIRDPHTLRELPVGTPGLIETFSTLPRSYPGHVLLTEDLGTVGGTDGCVCSRRGTYFTVHGRLPEAELRGCSDTYQENG